MTDRELLQAAKSAAERAYAPYSRFCVGAALLAADGTVYTGCNIENASYSATLCAERTAFAKAISDGKREFVKIAVVGGQNPCFPCGVCRQVMAEVCERDFEVILTDDQETVCQFTLEELLPFAFSL